MTEPSVHSADHIPTSASGASSTDEACGVIRVVTIDNPRKKNAFTASMALRLQDLLLEADRDPRVRAIVVTGADGDAFSSGHDLEEVQQNPETAGDPEANAGFTLPAQIGVPVIGAINGPAYAAGFILALNCDVRVAGEDARFCAVGARIGLVPVGGQLSRILTVLRYPDAFRLLATAAPIDATEALRIGLVSTVSAPDQTLTDALALAEEISISSPAVVRAAKAGLAATLSRGYDVGLELEPRLAALVRELPDGDEGVRSFLEKRIPAYPHPPADFAQKLQETANQ